MTSVCPICKSRCKSLLRENPPEARVRYSFTGDLVLVSDIDTTADLEAGAVMVRWAKGGTVLGLAVPVEDRAGRTTWHVRADNGTAPYGDKRALLCHLPKTKILVVDRSATQEVPVPSEDLWFAFARGEWARDSDINRPGLYVTRQGDEDPRVVRIDKVPIVKTNDLFWSVPLPPFPLAELEE